MKGRGNSGHRIESHRTEEDFTSLIRHKLQLGMYTGGGKNRDVDSSK